MADGAPSYLHNVRQWLCSPSIGRMTDKQYRCYHLLLNYSWLEEPRATLPNDDAELARLLRLPQSEWDLIKKPILAKFTTDGNGRIYNERLMQESDYLNSRIAGGKARAEQRASNAAAQAQHKSSIKRSKK